MTTLDAHPEYKTTRGILTSFAANYESPKDLVIGIVGVAIIGPTLGVIKSTKRKRGHMQIIIDQDWHAKSTETERIELIQTMSQKVIAKELGYASGHAYHLHPDSAEWCLSDPVTKVHAEPNIQLQTITDTARTENLSHTCIYTPDKQLRAVAVSPAVHDEFVDNIAD